MPTRFRSDHFNVDDLLTAPPGYEEHGTEAQAYTKRPKVSTAKRKTSKPLLPKTQNKLHELYSMSMALSDEASTAMEGDARCGVVFLQIAAMATKVQDMIARVKYFQNMCVSGKVSFAGSCVAMRRGLPDEGNAMQVCEWLRNHVGMPMLAGVTYTPGEAVSLHDQNTVHILRDMLENFQDVKVALSIARWERGEEFCLRDDEYIVEMPARRRNFLMLTTLGVVMQFLSCRLDMLHNKLQQGIHPWS